jgi:hypothetical protein
MDAADCEEDDCAENSHCKEWASAKADVALSHLRTCFPFLASTGGDLIKNTS